MPFIVRELGSLVPERLPARRETEQQYFARLALDFRTHERARRRQRVVAWLLRRRDTNSRPLEHPRRARSSRALD
jgi:hypothetical protein